MRCLPQIHFIQRPASFHPLLQDRGNQLLLPHLRNSSLISLWPCHRFVCSSHCFAGPLVCQEDHTSQQEEQKRALHRQVEDLVPFRAHSLYLRERRT